MQVTSVYDCCSVWECLSSQFTALSEKTILDIFEDRLVSEVMFIFVAVYHHPVCASGKWYCVL